MRLECSGMSREQGKAVRLEQWLCLNCEEVEIEKEDNIMSQVSHDTLYKQVKTKDTTLKILQLNIDSVMSKIEELKQLVKKHEVDIFMIQETKLTKAVEKDKPRVPGYTIIRKDREQPKGEENNRGGGLLVGIRKTVPYSYMDKLNIRGLKDHKTEAQTIEIPTGNKKKVRITNIYVPPHNSGQGGSGSSNVTRSGSSSRRVNTNAAGVSRTAVSGNSRSRSSIRSGSSSRGRRRADNRRGCGGTRNTGPESSVGEVESGRESDFDIRRWPSREFDIIVGDVNAHSLLWDNSMAGKNSDRRARMIEDWMTDKNMVVMNDGSSTHISRSSGSQTAPDVTLAHAALADRITWRTLQGIGSDHIPILITYQDHIPKVNSKPTFKWKLKDANWTSFSAEVDSHIPSNYAIKTNVNKLEKKLRKIILKAAGRHIGKKKITENTKSYLTQEVKEEIKKRNALRKTVNNNRSEWIESCQKVTEMIRNEKEKRWKEYVEELNRSSNTKKIFQTVRGIDGKVQHKKDNEVLEIKGVAYVADSDKAEQFAKTYRSFSKLKARKGDRRIKRAIRKEHKKTRDLEDSECDITMTEVLRVIKEASNGKAAGNDDIPYEMIKHLGPKAQGMLLDLYRKCWRGAGIPTAWRKACIKTLLKEDKDPKDPTSYRPISLTSCLGKILEKIIANRLIHLLEDRGLLTNNQAGFRPGRATVDQVLKLVQDASDNMQSQPRGIRTMATFFDYSKAYDTVWRDGLLFKMLEMKLPFRFIRYTRHFLSSRWTTVSINNIHSKPFMLRNGLPQGSSISPLLFLIFINDIDVDIDLETTASLFADDTSTWRADGKVRGSQRRLMQKEVDKIIGWADRWKMKVNGSKTKAMVIASSPKDQQWDPNLKAGETPIALEQEYRFLGTTVPSDLRFKKQVEQTVTKCRKRNRVLKCMSTKSWGNSLERQRMIYLVFCRTALEYNAPAWHPWISESKLLSLQRAQNDALRAVVGLTATCPTDFLHLEAGVEPVRLRLEKRSLLLREKYKRQKPSDPRRQMLEEEKTVRLKTRLGWRHLVKGTQPMNYRVEELKPPLPPWRETKFQFEEVKLKKRKEDHTTEELKLLADEAVEMIESEVIIFTDGSTDGNQNRGGAGVYIRDRRNGSTESLCYAAGEICSSYGAEGVALFRAIEWLCEKKPSSATICTDSMSLHKALSNDDWKDAQDWLRRIKEASYELETDVTILWVPSHCGCEGNEAADRLADEGTRLDQSEIPITMAIAQARIKKRSWEVTHERAAETYQGRKKPKFDVESSWPRHVRSLYARLRTGHCKELGHYKYMIETADHPFCECGEEETIEHVLCKCLILEVTRRSLFEEPVSLSHLTSEPEKCRKLLSRRFKGLTID